MVRVGGDDERACNAPRGGLGDEIGGGLPWRDDNREIGNEG